jgi:hypothetical protein
MTNGPQERSTSFRCVLAGGREFVCTGASCIFWEDGGTVLPGGCALERVRVDAEGRDVDELVLELHRRVEQLRAEDEAPTPA